MDNLLVDSYKLKELAEIEGKHPTTIKSGKIFSKNYIAVKFENSQSRDWYKAGRQAKPYTVRYIKLKDLKSYIEKKTWKKLVLIDKDL